MKVAPAVKLTLQLTARTLRLSPYPSAVLAVGSAVLTFLALASLAVPQVLDRQSERAYATAPIVDYDNPETTTDGLLTVDPLATPAERWNGHRIERRYYAGDSEEVRVPGISHVPGPDEFFASPELDRLLERDPVMRSLFSSLNRVGSISASGLSQPHELVAIIGVPRDKRLLLRPVEAFGSNQPLGSPDDFTVLNTTVAAIVGSLIWLPGIAFLVIITRLSARRNGPRVRSLRGLGVSATTTRAIQAGETALLVIPGILLGILAYNVVVTVLTRIPDTEFGFFRADAALSPIRQAGAAIAVLAMAAVLAGALQPVSWHARKPRRPRRFRHTTSDTVGITALGLGFGYLATLPVTTSWFGRFAILGMWISCALVACGLAVAGPRLARAVSSWLAARARTAGTLVGLRIVSSATTTTTRLASLACVVIVLLLGSLSFASILNGGTNDEWNNELARHDRVPLVATDITGSVDVNAVDQTYDGAFARSTTAEIGAEKVPILLATCGDLRELTGRPVDNCEDGTPRWANSAGPPIKVDELGTTTSPLPERLPVARSGALPEEFTGALVVSPGLLPGLRTTGGSQFYLLPKGNELVETMAALSATGPGIQFGIGDLDRKNPDFHQYPNQLEWIFVGAILSLLLVLLATVATALGETADREARLEPLRLLGAPRPDFIRAHIASTFVPVLTLGWTAAIAGWFACRGLQAVDDRASVPTSTVGTVIWATAFVALALAVTTLPEAKHQVSRRLKQ